MATLSVARAEPLATVERNGAFVAVDPYGPGIVRVTLATSRPEADTPPGFGVSGAPDPSGWSRSTTGEGDVFVSPSLRVTVAAEPWPKPPNQMERYFAPSLPPASLTISTADGQPIVRMTSWEKAPHTVAGEKNVIRS